MQHLQFNQSQLDIAIGWGDKLMPCCHIEAVNHADHLSARTTNWWHHCAHRGHHISKSFQVATATAYITAFCDTAGTDTGNSGVATLYYSVAQDSSDVYSADTAGNHSKLFTLEGSGPLLGLFWHSPKRQLASVASTGELCIHGEEEQGQGWQRMMKIKIGAGAAAGSPALMVAWIGVHILASASGRDDVVHLYDLETEDNYILRPSKHMPLCCNTACVRYSYTHMYMAYVPDICTTCVCAHRFLQHLSSVASGCLCICVVYQLQ